MLKEIVFTLTPAQAADQSVIKEQALINAGLNSTDNYQVVLRKRSIDARGRQVRIQLRCIITNETLAPILPAFNFKDVSKAPKHAVIVGFGPAGIFAALQFLLQGVKPIIIERGKNVRDRRRDLAALNKQGIVNTESNYCFGEGGAGTYSDGKLYTRSGKRGSIDFILQLFVHFGADPNILIDAHPHIGTNKLPQIITAMRQCIIDHGGQVLFDTRLEDIVITNNQVTKVITNTGTIDCTKLILATGHSARDIYILLHKKQIAIQAKPLAIGVRVEHPQQFVDETQYSCTNRDMYLPPASYSLVEQINGRGVFSFCMCPGGIIAPASTENDTLVVNGWSPSKRNNPFANSGMVVALAEQDLKLQHKHGALASMYYQQHIEQKAYTAGGGKMVAPAQRITDFVNHKVSTSLPANSYIPGLNSVDLQMVLPKPIFTALVGGFKAINNKMKGYVQQDAVVVATESRTSAPLRIPRTTDTLEHITIKGLYPCGEGAGYAGGIVSAAMDGIKVALAVYP